MALTHPTRCATTHNVVALVLYDFTTDRDLEDYLPVRLYPDTSTGKTNLLQARSRTPRAPDGRRMRAHGRTRRTRANARATAQKTQARGTTATSWTSTINGRRLVECRARGSRSSLTAQTQWRASSLTTQDQQRSHSRQLHQQNSSGGYRRHVGRHDSTLAASLPLEDPEAIHYEKLEADSRHDGAAAPTGDAFDHQQPGQLVAITDNLTIEQLTTTADGRPLATSRRQALANTLCRPASTAAAVRLARRIAGTSSCSSRSISRSSSNSSSSQQHQHNHHQPPQQHACNSSRGSSTHNSRQPQHSQQQVAGAAAAGAAATAAAAAAASTSSSSHNSRQPQHPQQQVAGAAAAGAAATAAAASTGSSSRSTG